MHILSPSSFSCRMSHPSLLFVVHSPTHSPTDQATSTPATNTMMTVFAEDLTLFRALSLLSFLSLLFCDPPSCPLSYFFLHSFLASFLEFLFVVNQPYLILRSSYYYSFCSSFVNSHVHPSLHSMMFIVIVVVIFCPFHIFS